MRASRESEKNKEKVTFYHVRKKGKLSLVLHSKLLGFEVLYQGHADEAEVSSWHLDIPERP